MKKQRAQFRKILKRVNVFLVPSGSHFDPKDVYRNVFQRFINRWLYCFNLVVIITHLIGEIAWFIYEFKTESIEKLTYIIPCVTLVILGYIKSYFLIRHGDHVNDLISSLKKGLTTRVSSELGTESNTKIVLLNAFININVVLYTIGFSLFAIGPLVLTWFLFKKTGKLEMQLPFLSKYPFDETDIRYWSLAYIHQMWSSFITVSTVHGSESFYSLSCTFLHIQYRTLHYDIERIIGNNSKIDYEIFKVRLVKIVKRHLELNRCVSLIETIYTKSTLCNVAVSPVVMCISALNITIIDEIVQMMPFIAFLIMWLLQMFSLCYYSNLLIQSSTEVSNAVYNSLWYKTDAPVMKNLLLVLTRAQKPCKLTAYGFTDLNLNVFNKIVSTAWSLFALLRTLYTKE